MRNGAGLLYRLFVNLKMLVAATPEIQLLVYHRDKLPLRRLSARQRIAPRVCDSSSDEESVRVQRLNCAISSFGWAPF
jgi:hypothetical protein